MSRRAIAALLFTALAGCGARDEARADGPIPSTELARAAQLIARREPEAALRVLDELERDGAPAIDRAKSCEVRLVALASLGRLDELLEAADWCACGRSLEIPVVGRVAVALLAAGKRLDEVQPLLALADSARPEAIEHLRQALAEEARRHEQEPPVCGFCLRPKCDLECEEASSLFWSGNCDFGRPAAVDGSASSAAEPVNME